MDLADYNIVFNSLSFAIATFGAGTVFFFAQRSQVAPAYKTALTLSGLVCLIAFYHYLRMFESFNHAYELSNGVVTATGAAFNDAYRYVDWLLTVPLLLLELVLVMRLSKEETYSRGTKLAFAAALMIILGYPGEISAETGTKMLYFVLSMIPFLYILYVLFGELSNSLDRQPDGVAKTVGNLRLLLIGTWLVYPISYLIPVFITSPSATEAASLFTYRQVGYTVADVLAKCVFGLTIYKIARMKSIAEGMPADH